MEQMCWRTEDWEDIPNIKRTYEELISFIAKNRENILRSNFENAIVTLSFVSAGFGILRQILFRERFHCIAIGQFYGEDQFSREVKDFRDFSSILQ